jgi:hypothetical protein
MSSEVSSIAPRTQLMSSSVRVASNYGLLGHIFILAEGFFEVIFLFCGVTVPIGGYSSGVASPPPPCSYSPSSPPPYPSTSSPPPPSKPDPLSPEVFSLSSSSFSMSWISPCFSCFFIPLDCLTCSTHVTICSTTQVFQQRTNTFSNHSHNQIKDQHTDVFTW